MKLAHLISRGALAAALVAAAQPGWAQTALPESGAAAPSSEIIVTGTRTTGLTAAESATPIKLLGTEAIQHVGQPNLNQVLTQLIPSFNAAAFGGDTAELTLSARLRGLSPNQTLVLINGKRRHSTANLAVLAGTSQGGAAPDLDFIAPNSIKRIEVLEDGAAAQYGSDAIAGVINIILKDGGDGGSASATIGQYYKSDGEQKSGTINLGTKIGDEGFINLTGMYRIRAHSQVGGKDCRIVTPDGNLYPVGATTCSGATITTAKNALYANALNFPNVNRINGDLSSELYQGEFNAGYNIGDVQLYGFGTIGYRTAAAYENYRLPDRVIASPVLGVGGTLATPGELIFAPQGFNPKEGFRELDYAVTAGAKGEFSGFTYDLSATYGRDRDVIDTLDSINASLYVDTHTMQTDIYDGQFINDELTGNADFTKQFDVGMAEPLNVAFGAEYRKQRYEIQAGDAASRYKEGGQSYPGFQLTDAGRHSRHNESLYIDVAATPMEQLKFDGAVRYEHYSDFGSKVIAKGTARYDFTEQFALRGTIANGFRAPTLPEEFYSATNVSPTNATVQLPANSAAAKLIGFSGLKPERSMNYSLGTVMRPTSRVTITVDAYQISIKDRILGSGTLQGRLNGVLVNQAVLDAIAAHGNVLDPTVGTVGLAGFTNGANTRTRGIDVVGSYSLPMNSMGKFDFTLSGNYNDNKVTHVDPTKVALFDLTAISLLETSSPKFKVIGGINWSLGPVTATFRETLYGKVSEYLQASTGTYYKSTIGTAALSDIELGYSITHGIKISAGSNNLFNKKAPTTKLINTGGAYPVIATGSNNWDAPLTFSPYGINGGYYYARLDLSF